MPITPSNLRPRTGAPATTLTVELFEYVPYDSSLGLVRVGGRWSGSPPERVELAVRRGFRRTRVEGLPDAGPGAGTAWCAGFPIPSALCGRRTTYALEWPGGRALDLGTPVRHTLRRADGGVDPAAPARHERSTSELKRQVDVRERELEVLRRELMIAWAERDAARAKVAERDRRGR